MITMIPPRGMRPKAGSTKKKSGMKAFSKLLLVILASCACLVLLQRTHTNTRQMTEVLSSQSRLSSTPLLQVPNGEQNDDTMVVHHHRKKPSQIRYAAFGTSMTWGSGIGNGDLEERKTFGYPWLLSQNATNLAIRAGGPAYAATCTSTMVGTEIFDVIVFEFYMRAHEGLLTLVRRIRERFPDALLIFLITWNPTMIGRCSDESCHLSGMQSMAEWVEEHGLNIKHGGLYDPNIHQLFKETNETWSWQQFVSPLKRTIVQEIAREVGGYISYMQAPENPGDWIQYADFFASDAHHLSVKGHMDVAQRVYDIVNVHGVPQNPRLQKFMHPDYCINWFETGKTDGIEYSPNGVVERITNRKVINRNKYALHWPGVSYGSDGSVRGYGWIRVNNPGDSPLALYLGYMTTGPPPSVYPRTEITIEGLWDNGGRGKRIGGEPVVLDVDAVDEFGDRMVHISRVAKIGIINPGKSLVRFQEIEKTEASFRLVSVLVASDGAGDYLSQLPGGVDKYIAAS